MTFDYFYQNRLATLRMKMTQKKSEWSCSEVSRDVNTYDKKNIRVRFCVLHNLDCLKKSAVKKTKWRTIYLTLCDFIRFLKFSKSILRMFPAVFEFFPQNLDCRFQYELSNGVKIYPIFGVISEIYVKIQKSEIWLFN